MSSGKKSDSNFLVQGSILAIASIVSRIIGLLYRIPMTNIIGDTGNSYYSAASVSYTHLDVYKRQIMTMPGLPKVPAANNIDVTNDGVITGLF